MANPPVTYNALNENEGNPFTAGSTVQQPSSTDPEAFRETDNEDDEPHNSGVMIHVVPETSRARWNHIEDLDSFFTRMYHYHQRHGFSVMMLQEMFGLLQFPFVIFLIIGLTHCVNYPVLFNEQPNSRNSAKTTIADVLLPPAQCFGTLGGFAWAVILLSALVWTFRLIKFLYHFIQYYDIKLFFNTALKIADSELDNLTWHEVQKRVREVQSEQQMCIHKEQLTELDIYHRILRFKNYMVAMMNKGLIPSYITFPLLGEYAVLSRGLKYNIEFILFWGPFSPFENNWNLKEEYKRSNRRMELARKLSAHITWVALINLIFSPFLLVWQMMYFFFNYADIIKREPGSLGLRCWSQHGKLFLRHFNELDHELDARLNRAYRPAVKYMNSFSSPLLTVLSRQIIFFFGGIAGILIVLSIYDEDVLHVEHVLTIITICTALVVAARGQIPDENLIWCPEQLLLNILAHAHYLPSSWCGSAHTAKVRNQFEHFFQLKAMYIVNELFSPILTPFILYSQLRPKALDIVDFFRNFTVSVVGVGDVCSFAQMDVRKHGNPDWQITKSAGSNPSDPPPPDTNQYTQGEHGKTELSLVHFTLTNPDWKMPNDARQFVQGIKRNAYQDLAKARGQLTNNTAMGQSLIALDCLGGDYSSIVNSVLATHNLTSSHLGMSMFGQNLAPSGYFNPHSVNPIISPMSQQQANFMTSPQSLDFMLQQNLTDHSTALPLRSGYLHNITEDEDQSEQENDELINQPSAAGNSACLAPSNVSIRGGLSRREGPPSGSQNGLLYSLYGNNTETAVVSPEFTVADMCLSTLYLHELHQRHVKRRGIRLEQEQSQRHIWQRPHQESSTPAHQSSTPILQHPFGTTLSLAARQERAAERTPLLSSKKS